MRLIPMGFSLSEPRALLPGTADNGVYVPGSTLWAGCTQGCILAIYTGEGYLPWYTGLYTTRVYTPTVPPWVYTYCTTLGIPLLVYTT